MTYIRSFLKTQTVLYDFDKDGGAVGSINAGITIPNTAVMLVGCFQELTPLNDLGAGAIFNVGWAGNINAVFFSGIPVGITPFIYAIPCIFVGLPILFTITGAPIVAGKVLLDINYLERRV